MGRVEINCVSDLNVFSAKLQFLFIYCSNSNYLAHERFRLGYNSCNIKEQTADTFYFTHFKNCRDF